VLSFSYQADADRDIAAIAFAKPSVGGYVGRGATDEKSQGHLTIGELRKLGVKSLM
jgi:hypothetical protein